MPEEDADTKTRKGAANGDPDDKNAPGQDTVRTPEPPPADNIAAAASAPPEKELATEKPVLLGAVPTSTEYVVTVDNITGVVEKIERLLEGGKRQEISDAEYVSLGVRPDRASSPGTYGAAMSATAYGPLSGSALHAYYQGVAQYLRALAGYGRG